MDFANSFLESVSNNMSKEVSKRAPMKASKTTPKEASKKAQPRVAKNRRTRVGMEASTEGPNVAGRSAFAGREAASELARLDATEQAAWVASGQLTSRESIEAAIGRVESCDGELGAIPVRFFERALLAAEVQRPGAPFAGVPFLMKDVGARQIGQPYYAANRALRDVDHRAVADTPLGARFREVGLLTLGNSSTPEFAMQSNTWSLAYGPTRNPWNPAHSAGGSSGGACAAVAAGIVPVAHASDGAGSIRIPAAWCGLIGLKPTRDRVIWRHAGKQRPDVEFVVARSLRDTAALLDLLRPAAERSAEPGRFLRSIESEARSMQIGFCRRSPAGTPVHPSCRVAVERTLDALEKRGHRVVDDAPAALATYVDRTLYGAVLGPLGFRECLDELAERLGRPVDARDVEPFLWELSTHPETVLEGSSQDDIERAIEWTQEWERALLGWFDGNDVLVTPTVHMPAPELDSFDPTRHTPLELLEKMVPHMAFTEPFNATGQPAISLPLGQSPDGLPVGVQLVGRIGREDDLLSLAADLLEDLGPGDARPRIHA